MAETSGLTASTSSATSSDLAARQPLLYPTSTLGSMNMDDLLHNIYADSPGEIAPETNPEVRFPEMTLEDYLARTGVGEEVKVEGTGSVVGLGGEGGGGGRGRRRVGFDQADKIAQQRQRRMIKNRESAARSRERKQAYTVELESQVAKLEEQNARLKQEQEQQRKKRLKQLLESRVPVIEKRRTPRPLRRTNSMQW